MKMIIYCTIFKCTLIINNSIYFVRKRPLLSMKKTSLRPERQLSVFFLIQRPSCLSLSHILQSTTYVQYNKTLISIFFKKHKKRRKNTHLRPKQDVSNVVWAPFGHRRLPISPCCTFCRVQPMYGTKTLISIFQKR